MIFDRIAELKIREAITEGKFDNLPNAGQPIDLEDYFRTPPEMRLAHSILKSANCLPEELQLLNEIAALERAVVNEGEDAAQARRRFRDCRLRLGILLERNHRSREKL